MAIAVHGGITAIDAPSSFVLRIVRRGVQAVRGARKIIRDVLENSRTW
jgi:hypothetical protein